MRVAALVFMLAGYLPAAELTISPAIITQCVDGAAKATLSWKDAGTGLVQVRIGGPSGQALTGWEQPEGKADTGTWVINGMVFSLMDSSGIELASVTAQVRCGAVTDLPANSGYWPLATGNRWVFRYSSRWITSAYKEWRVTGTAVQNGKTWSVLDRPEGPWVLREDEQGRIWRLVLGGEQLILDPGTSPDPSALQTVTVRRAVSTVLGEFADGLEYQSTASMILETGAYARGVGPVSSTSSMLAGSSGGFWEGYQLVEARVNGRLWTTSIPRIELNAESLNPDVTGKKVTNCAVPCYFVACGLVPGADPAGTYKPCMQTRMGVENAPGGSSAVLELLDPRGNVLSSQPVAIALPGAVYIQMSLYSAPNEPYPPGDYLLRARLRDSQGIEKGSAALTLHLQ